MREFRAVDASQIRAGRERLRMTQAELAAAVGVGPKTVSNWELGHTVPRNRMAMLEDLFGKVQVDPDTDPLRAASEVALLAELLRRATEREHRGR